MTRFVVNSRYDRAALHEESIQAGFKPGNRQQGITVICGENCIFWNPFKAAYVNEWIREPDEFIYMGEGTEGPMTFSRGNGRLQQAHLAGRPVTVFYRVERSGPNWLCLGEYTVSAITEGISYGDDNQLRDDIRFTMLRSDTAALTRALPHPKVMPVGIRSEAELWTLVASHSNRTSGVRSRRTTTHRNKRVSSPALTEYVLRRAIDNGGKCELCEQAPGWFDDGGYPHFQAHHIDPEIDFADWIVALCGTCHDRMHHSSDRQELAKKLRETVRNLQVRLGRPIFEP